MIEGGLFLRGGDRAGPDEVLQNDLRAALEVDHLLIANGRIRMLKDNGGGNLRAIRRIGRERVILCRVGTDQAIATGESLGISLFQGRMIDNMLQAWGSDATRLPPAAR